MKIKTQKLNQKQVTDSVVTAVGLVGGFMLGGGISAVVPDKSREVARVAIAGAGILGGTLLKGGDPLNDLLKYASLGASAREIYGLATDALKKNTTVNPNAKILEKAYYGAIGLACACSDNYGGGAYVPALGNPLIIDTVYDEESGVYSPSSQRASGML